MPKEYPDIDVFKWRSTGVLFMGIALLIATMHYGKDKTNLFVYSGFIISIILIGSSTLFIRYVWKFYIDDEKSIRKEKLVRKNHEKICPQCNRTLNELIQYECPDCGRLIFKKKEKK